MLYEDQKTDQKQISYYYGVSRIIVKSKKGNGVDEGEDYYHDNLSSMII